jgi:hypothetical protein
VAQKLLQRPQIRAVSQKVGGKTMPEGVRRYAVRQPEIPTQSAQTSLRNAGIQNIPSRPQKSEIFLFARIG